MSVDQARQKRNSRRVSSGVRLMDGDGTMDEEDDETASRCFYILEEGTVECRRNNDAIPSLFYPHTHGKTLNTQSLDHFGESVIFNGKDAILNEQGTQWIPKEQEVSTGQDVVEYIALDELVVVLAIDRHSLNEIITPSLYQYELNNTEGGPLLVAKNNVDAVQVVASDSIALLTTIEAEHNAQHSFSSPTSSSSSSSSGTFPSKEAHRPRSTSFSGVLQTIHDGIREQNLNTVLNRTVQHDDQDNDDDDEYNDQSQPPSPMHPPSFSSSSSSASTKTNIRQVQLSNFNRKYMYMSCMYIQVHTFHVGTPTKGQHQNAHKLYFCFHFFFYFDQVLKY